MGIFNTGYNEEQKIKQNLIYSLTYFESVLMRIQLAMEIASQFVYKKKLIKLNDLNNFINIHETLIPYKSRLGILIYLPYFSSSSNNSIISVKTNDIKKNTYYQLITILNVKINTDEEKNVIIGIGGLANDTFVLKNGIVKFKLSFTTNDVVTNTRIYMRLYGSDGAANLKSSDKICILFFGIRVI